MARYISLIRFTAQGVRQIRKSSQRAKAFARAAEKAGVTVEGQYWTVGAYDGALILKADNRKKIIRCLANLVALGDVTTETLESFDSDEMKGVLGA